MAPAGIGIQYSKRRQPITPSNAGECGTPKPINAGTITPSTIPSPPGVSGKRAKTLPTPYTVSNGPSPIGLPNAASIIQKEPASNSQFPIANAHAQMILR